MKHYPPKLGRIFLPIPIKLDKTSLIDKSHMNGGKFQFLGSSRSSEITRTVDGTGRVLSELPIQAARESQGQHQTQKSRAPEPSQHSLSEDEDGFPNKPVPERFQVPQLSAHTPSSICILGEWKKGWKHGSLDTACCFSSVIFIIHPHGR